MKALTKAATSRGNKALVIAGAAAFAAVSLQAANKTWDGGGANDNWNTQNNWNNDTNPVAADDVFLGSAFTSGTTISLGATRTVNSFTIGTTSGFTISNNQLTITSGNLTRTAASSGNQTFASIVSLTNAGTWNIAGSGTTTITGNIAGAGGYTKTGTGTLVIGGAAKTYTGNTTLNSGNVVLDYTTAGNKFGGGGGVVTLGGATLTLTNGNTTENNGSTVIAAGHSIVNRAAGTSILQTDVITRNIGSTVNFGAAGIATTDSTNTNGILGGWVTVSGTTWGFNASNGNNGAINGLATYETSNVQTNWAATENISLASNPTTNITTRTINSLRFTSSSTMTITAANTLTLASGGVMGVGAASTVITGGTLTAGTSSDLIVHQNSTADMTINSVIAGAAKGLTKSGTGRLVLGGANTYTGQTYLNQGTLSISSNANLGAPGTGAQINLNGGTLQATASFALNNAGANHRNIALADNGGTIEVTASNTLSITGTITGNGGLTKTGAGSLTISAANTYTGNTVISIGELFIDGIQTAATGAVNVNGGTLGGNGTIGGITTVANNALLAPGKSEGKLTFISGLNLGASDAKTRLEITGTSRGVLGGYDAVDIGASGSLIYGGDLSLSMTTTIQNGIYDLFSFTAGPTGSFDTIGFAGGLYTGSFVNNGSGVWTANTNGKLFTFTQSTGDLTVVPEPSIQLYLTLGAALMFWFKRARRKSLPIAG